MVNTYESINSQNKTSHAEEWSELDSSDEDSVDLDRFPNAHPNEEPPEQKAQKLQDLKTRVQASFAGRTDIQSGPEHNDTKANAGETIGTDARTGETPTKGFLSKIRMQKLDRMMNGPKRDALKTRRKIIQMIESGKVELDDPRVVDRYIKIKLFTYEPIGDKQATRSKTRLEKIIEMEQLGISPDRPMLVLAEKMVADMNKSVENEYDSYSKQFDIPKSYMKAMADSDVPMDEMITLFNKYGSPRVSEYVIKNANVQAFGDKLTNSIISKSTLNNVDDSSPKIEKQFESARGAIDFMKSFGYIPFKNGVEPLCKGSAEEEVLQRQGMANRLSLLDGHIVDKIYHYKIDSLNDQLRKRTFWGIKNVPILERLKCSGEDPVVSFWENYSSKNGRDELFEIAKEAKSPKGSIFLEIAKSFEKGEDNSEELMNFMLDNIDSLNGADRGFALAIKSVLHRDIDDSVLLGFSKEQKQQKMAKEAISLTYFLLKKYEGDKYWLLFNDNGISGTARETAIFNYDFRDLVEKFDPGWESHFSNEMQNLINHYSPIDSFKEQPELLDELSPERRSLIELSIRYPNAKFGSMHTENLAEYFDEKGEMKPQLAKRLFDRDRKFLCSAPEIYNLLPLPQQRYLEILNIIGYSSGISNFSDDEISQYFDDNGPRADFWQYEFLSGDFNGIKRYLEENSNADEESAEEYNWEPLALSAIQKSVISSYDKIPDQNLRSAILSFLSEDKLEKYFDENGPTEDFWQFEFNKGNFDCLIEQKIANINELGLSKKQFEALRIYSELEDAASKNDFRIFASDNCNEIPIDRLRAAPRVLSRLSLTNSSEIFAHRSAFASQLLRIDLDDDEKMFASLERIEDVFVHNNLPFVGKAFLSFQILHPSSTLDKDFDFSEQSTISPSLKNIPNNASQALDVSGKVRNRETIILSDLLKTSFSSNNRSIREYLKNLKEGQALVDGLLSGEISWDRFADTESTTDDIRAERETLSIFAQHLNVLYNNTEFGKKEPKKITGDLKRDITELVDAFSPTERYSLSDRIVRNFAYFAGIKNFAEAEAFLNEKAEAADQRNRVAAKKNDLKLESGDFIKGLNEIRYLPNILQNGSVAREFLGDSAGTDATPLDTDVSVVIGEPENISSGIRETEASGYGPVWAVLKGDGNRSGESRFSITRRAPGEQNQQIDPPNIGDKIEAFYTGAIGSSHYGIRTGFGSSEIDFFISNPEDINGTPISKVIGMQTALNGFYIPVVDKEKGEIVFSPEEYDEIRKKMSGLSHYGADEYIASQNADLNIGSFEINGVKIPSVNELVSQSSNNRTEVDKKRNAIYSQVMLPVLQQFALSYKPYIDGDLTEGVAEVIDTGSTGRYSNAPNDGDFDFMMKLDRRDFGDPTKMDRIRDAFCELMGIVDPAEKEEAIKGGNFRVKNVQLDGLDAPVDIDITFAQKTNKVQYSTDMALNDFYSSMTSEQRSLVVANVIFAKKFLKAAGVYKPDRGDKPQGGLGGVGVENWIIQNGGSFVAAAKEFMEAAEKCKDFAEFKKIYAVWDFGENHIAKGKKQHDNFVADNMSSAGYEKMKAALAEFLAQQS